MSEAPFPHLFSPLTIGPVTVPNRIFMPPHLTGYATDHKPSDQHVYYYRERARGGVGLIVAESSAVHPTSLTHRNKIAVYDETCIPGFRRIVEAVRPFGTKVFIQLTHNGREMTGFWSGLPVWAPSPIPCPGNREIPHAMTTDEIQEVIAGFRAGARNAVAAGADGVEVHGAHGYLVEQFLSPWTNHRTDAYGGSVENRMRFLLEVLEAVRAEIGNGVAMGLRVNGDEFHPEGLQIGDMVEICREVDGTGLVDYISVSAGTHATKGLIMGDASVTPGLYVPYAAAIRQVVNVPVAAVMRIFTPEMGEDVVEQGKADMIGMVRALIADPHLPAKARGGRSEEIRLCPGFNQECRRGNRGGGVQCVQNPEAGREYLFPEGALTPAPVSKHVVVIGGGPGGLEAARVAAERGHKVTLYEQTGTLGGQVNVAALGPTRSGVAEAVRYRATMLQKLGVRVILNCRVTPEMLLGLSPQPDAVIVATGSVPNPPAVEGSKESPVRLTHPAEILTGAVEPSGPVVVVDGGESSWPCYSAVEYLANKGLKVDVITPLRSPGASIPEESIGLVYKRVMAGDVTFWPTHGLRRLEGGAVVAYNVYNQGREVRFEADTLVLAYGNKVNDGLAAALHGKIPVLFTVGDCVSPRQITEAVREGWEAGRAV